MELKHTLCVLGVASLMIHHANGNGEFELEGHAGYELRHFWGDASHLEQFDGVNSSVHIQPESNWRSEGGHQRVNFIGFYRWDEHDDERTHGDIREFYWGYEAEGWDILVGINKVFWGVTESNHLVDIINSADFIEDIDSEDKLGQPMLNLNVEKDWGALGFYILPYFREPTASGMEGRFRPALVVDTDNPIYESEDEEEHVDYALRYSHYIGDMDLGLSFFTGTSREARFIPNQAFSKLIPVFDLIEQVGVDLQYTREQWLWKFEAIYRSAEDYDFLASTAGLEYTFYQAFESGTDLGVLIEYQYDDRPNNAPLTLANDDLFIGARWTLNDTQDTSVLGGFSVDLEHQDVFYNLEAERRLSDAMTASLRMRIFSEASEEGGLASFANDDYVQFRLNWFF